MAFNNGWPILDELTALNDRIQLITRRSHTSSDIDDLTSWVEHKMSPGATARVATPLADLLQHHAADYPTAAHRFDRLLEHLTETAPARNVPALTYLQHQLRHAHQTTRPRAAVR